MIKNTLYHYCSLDTLISILKNKTFRLSDVNKLNDKHETKTIVNLLREIVYDKLKTCIQREFIIAGMSNDSALSYIAETTINQIIANNETLQFVFCLSENCDLLSQWRGYGDNGRGVSIGFDVDVLNEMIEGLEDFTFKKINYIDKGKTDFSFFQSIADTITQQILSAIELNRLDWMLTNPIGSDTFDKFQRMEIYQHSAFFKDISFKEEQEHRIIYTPMTYKTKYFDENIMRDKKELFPNGVQFKSIGNNLVSYIDLIFTDVADEIIQDIIIGPNCNIDDSDIEYILKAYGLFNTAETVEPSKSKSAYRIY